MAAFGGGLWLAATIMSTVLTALPYPPASDLPGLIRNLGTRASLAFVLETIQLLGMAFFLLGTLLTLRVLALQLRWAITGAPYQDAEDVRCPRCGSARLRVAKDGSAYCPECVEVLSPLALVRERQTEAASGSSDQSELR